MLPFVLEQDYGCVANESPEGERGADESPTSDAQNLTTHTYGVVASLRCGARNLTTHTYGVVASLKFRIKLIIY